MFGQQTSIPHGVRQRQDAQRKEVERQQQVDVFLGKHLQPDVRVCSVCVRVFKRNSGIKAELRCLIQSVCLLGCVYGCVSAHRYLKEEVEAKQGDAGDDGEASSISTGDGLWYVGSVLRRSKDTLASRATRLPTQTRPG